MREIKFRSYHREDKVMVYDLNSPRLIHGELRDDDYIFMQYTGLRDKNGIEIYEVDILKRYEIPLSESPLFSVIYDAPCFCFQRFHKKGIDEELVGIVPWRILDMEVIGNIYENPELIKDKE
jgi:uncharacterized phage protein (TIGR01671 family)